MGRSSSAICQAPRLSVSGGEGVLVVGAEEEEEDEGERKTGEAAVEPTPPFPAWKTKKKELMDFERLKWDG